MYILTHTNTTNKMTTTLSVRIDTVTKKRLEAPARRARRGESVVSADPGASYGMGTDSEISRVRVGRAVVDVMPRLSGGADRVAGRASHNGAFR